MDKDKASVILVLGVLAIIVIGLSIEGYQKNEKAKAELRLKEKKIELQIEMLKAAVITGKNNDIESATSPNSN